MYREPDGVDTRLPCACFKQTHSVEFLSVRGRYVVRVGYRSNRVWLSGHEGANSLVLVPVIFTIGSEVRILVIH
jgi:hypothetical protein